MIDVFTSFAFIEENQRIIRRGEKSLSLSEQAALNALTYKWHGAGNPKMLEIADREFDSIVGICRQHAWRVRRSLMNKGLINFRSSQGKTTTYFFSTEAPQLYEDKQPKRASAEPIRNKEALIAHMRHKNPEYESVNLEKHYNDFAIWHAQNAPERVLTPKAFRAWMRNQVKNGYPLYPLSSPTPAPTPEILSSPTPVPTGKQRLNKW